jgi:predicted DNA-binding transcriptional regulator AlpA
MVSLFPSFYFCTVQINVSAMKLVIITEENLATLIRSTISKELSATPESPQLPDRCSIKEALEITGLSKSRLYKLTASYAIPCSKFRKRLVFSRIELLRWVENQTKEKFNASASSLVLARSAQRKG